AARRTTQRPGPRGARLQPEGDGRVRCGAWRHLTHETTTNARVQAACLRRAVESFLTMNRTGSQAVAMLLVVSDASGTRTPACSAKDSTCIPWRATMAELRLR